MTTMTTTARPVGTRAQRVGMAIEHLRKARDLLTAAGAKRSVDRVRRATDSAEGARRHAESTKDAKEAQP